ncbi:MAG: choice-of-anchor Q domain-containing protein [Planctomycetota bacterium]
MIWTDSFDWPGWFAYMTCEGIFEGATENINVCSWRGESGGTNWMDELVVYGNLDSYPWRDPDGSYGTTDNGVYLVAYNDELDTLSFSSSMNYGTSYSTPADIYTMSTEPVNSVDPEIEAAAEYDNIMVCCTRHTSGSDCIGQMYSEDGGASWTPLYTLDGYTSGEEFGVALFKDPGPATGFWHLAYTGDHSVYYSQRLQNLASYWQAVPDLVDDANYASHNHPKKGVTANWDHGGGPGIVWSDYRDGGGSYDIYYDFLSNPFEYYVPGDFSTIQAAIDASKDDSIIHVAPGTYEENINFNGLEITLTSTDGPTYTVIDGGALDSVVNFVSGEGFGAVIEGFTLTNGLDFKGGGIYCEDASPVIRNMVITGNLATNGGGAYFKNSNAIMTHTTVSLNNAASAGAGVLCSDGGDIWIVNSIIYENDSPWNPELYAGYGISDPLVEYCVIRFGYASGTHIIDEDPLFVDPDSGDFHILYTSPCRNAGTNSPPSLPDFDFEGDPRIADGTADIGADEFYRHIYYIGDLFPTKDFEFKFIGTPGKTQVGFWLGLYLLETPLTLPVLGTWYIAGPNIGPAILGTMPADGVIVIPATIPKYPPGPYTFYAQALIGPPLKATNLCTFNVK